ncbi:MAG: amidohydrolase, partial [Alphaproteobacteria bacterium]|nr:amidohydrolase [Alphaproteobacteria bacterium]
MPILNRIAELAQDAQVWRRELHQHPELLFDVHRTAAFVAEQLRAFGCDEVVTGLGRTGVVGVLKGRLPGTSVIGLRADMDALPMQEETDLPYGSKTKGLMHACGHDGHTAMLLGAARYLAETRNFAGTAIFIFQPAEENGGAGARAMIEDGLMQRFGIQEVYALHNQPGLPIGAFALNPGPILASSTRVEIEVRGTGGHASRLVGHDERAVAAERPRPGPHLLRAGARDRHTHRRQVLRRRSQPRRRRDRGAADQARGGRDRLRLRPVR